MSRRQGPGPSHPSPPRERADVMSPKRRRHYRRRPRVSARAPGCGCIGCSIPLLMCLGAAAVVIALTACSAPGSGTSAAPAVSGSVPAMAAAAATGAACPSVTDAVNAIASAGHIDLATGSMTSTITGDEADLWESELGTAGKAANSLGDKASATLATDLVKAQGATTDLSLDLGAGKGQPQLDSDASAFITDLQAVQSECASN